MKERYLTVADFLHLVSVFFLVCVCARVCLVAHTVSLRSAKVAQSTCASVSQEQMWS